MILGLIFSALTHGGDMYFLCIPPRECKKENVLRYTFKKANPLKFRANNSIRVYCNVKGEKKVYKKKVFGGINFMTFSSLGVSEKNVVFENDTKFRKKMNCYCQVNLNDWSSILKKDGFFHKIFYYLKKIVIAKSNN